QVLRKRDEEVAEEEDREGKSERRVREPDPPVPVVQVSVFAEELQEGDERGLDRDDHEDDHDEEDRVPEGKRNPGERVGGESAERERKERRGHGDDQAVHPRVAHPRGMDHGAVVVQREVRVREYRPRSARRDVGTRAERGDRQPDGWNEPDDPDHEQRDMDRRASRGGSEPAPERRGPSDRRSLERRHAITRSLRKRRTLKIITGSRMRSITTATAAP